MSVFADLVSLRLGNLICLKWVKTINKFLFFVGLPEDCDEAAKHGYETGEVLILPDPNQKPLLVYCKIDKHTETGRRSSVY